MKPNILFVNLPPLPFDYIELYSKGLYLHQVTLAMPMGILYLSSFLKANNDLGKVEMLDFSRQFDQLNQYSSIDEFIQAEAVKHLNLKPDIIAISLMFSTSHRFFELTVKVLKVLWPQALHVVGGIHATNCPQHLLEHNGIDRVILGEGELALSQIVKQYAQHETIDVKGVYDKESIRTNKPLLLSAIPKELDDLPFPDWDLIDMDAYSKMGWRRVNSGSGARSATILTSRGCPYMCIFCAAHTVHGRKVRYRSVENVLEEISLLNKRFSISHFTPADDYITADKKRILRLLSEIKNLNIPDIEMLFTNAININSMDEEILDALIRTGTRTLDLALESGSETVQKSIMKKNVNLSKAKDLVALCRKKGVITQCNVILGFVGETKELLDETANYLRDLGSDWYTFTIAAPLIGTEFYQQCLEKGYIKEDVHLWSITNFNERTFDTCDVTAEALKEYKYRLNLDVNFINNINLRNGDYERALALFQNIVKDYPFHIFGWYGISLAHRKKGNTEEADCAWARMQEVLNQDVRAQTMYAKYKDLLPEEASHL